MAKVANYQCPACTGPLHFVGSSGKLECDYCGSSFTVAEIDALYKDKVDEAKTAADKEKEAAEERAANEKAEEAENTPDFADDVKNDEWNKDEISMYNCSSCGAEIISEKNTVATSCPYCGNPTVIPGQFNGGVMPDYVIPFKYDKNAAVNALTNYYKGKKLLPKVFSKQNHISEVKGIYVPFWLYDGEIYADVSMVGTNTHVHRSGEYEITETDVYNIRRAGTVPFTKVPADGSEKMDDALMDSIEPFDYSELKDFSTSYLPGFYAESYDVSKEKCLPRIKTRVETSALNIMKNSAMGYQTLTVSGSRFTMKNCKARYAFLPVWLLNTQWKGKNFQFAVNGQTGKIVGNLPVDKGRFCGWLFGLTALIGAIASVAIYFISRM